MRKLVLNGKNSALMQMQTRQLFGHRSTNIFTSTCSYIHADQSCKEVRVALISVRHTTPKLAFLALICENLP